MRGRETRGKVQGGDGWWQKRGLVGPAWGKLIKTPDSAQIHSRIGYGQRRVLRMDGAQRREAGGGPSSTTKPNPDSQQELPVGRVGTTTKTKKKGIVGMGDHWRKQDKTSCQEGRAKTKKKKRDKGGRTRGQMFPTPSFGDI